MTTRTTAAHEILEPWRAADGAADADELARTARAAVAEAERRLAGGGDAGPAESAGWHDYLEETGVPAFLTALGDAETRNRWTDTAIAATRRSAYTLETMLAQRARTIGDHVLFDELGHPSPAAWTYARVRRRTRAFAATFLAAKGESTRVALLVDNCVDGACCDLACLLHDILITPLNVHFNVDELAWIFDRLRITVAVADTEERVRRLLEVRRRARTPFVIFTLQGGRAVEQGEAELLGEAMTHLTPDRIDGLLAERPRRGLDEIATVMFTSGSTGRPKGVAFTSLNLISKRFARAAALPAVGHGEKLLCYLPLFHTFGRFLEMIGMLFWRGTYVFAGNPSTGTLLAGLRETQPTGLIGVPLRWVQIRDRVLESAHTTASEASREEAFRAVVGKRLRWGLSAAGHLDPKVFRFFQRHGVDLCSGFGMTEATGGITMSPPGDYIDNTVGVPLPGINVRMTEVGEMQISGPYVARYLCEDGDGLDLAPMIEEDGEQWLASGDLFKELERGHLTIVDRIKDIYKNDRGQTVAPRRVERLFEGVPGIRRTFLVGDNRSYNVLLIVPDDADPVLAEALDEQSRREYFRQIIAAANQDLAPYERVVNFALLGRDFALELDELTPKGSYRRRNIEDHFAVEIDGLYQSAYAELTVDGLTVRVPRWFFRDLGILEDDILIDERGLHDRHRELHLPLYRNPDEPIVRVGDLEYTIDGGVVDLGVFSRQPHLWVGNPALIAFSPCREGWDVPFGGVSPNVLLPRGSSHETHVAPVDPSGVGDTRLIVVNRLVQIALFSREEKALSALLQLKRELVATEDKIGVVVRRRITALARHDQEEIRCLAYRIMLLDDPIPDHRLGFPAFIESGLSFLNEESLEVIASARFERRRLEALRRRFSTYRQRLSWPASDTVRCQFEYALRMLVGLVHRNPSFYKAVRVELASWVLHERDQSLSEFARAQLDELVSWYEQRLERTTAPIDPQRARELVIFDEDISEEARTRLCHLLLGTTFLKQSIILTYYEEDFDLDQLATGGIWVSRLRTRSKFHLDRVSVNTISGRHFELLVIQRQDMNAEAVINTNYWMASIAGYPFGQRALPRFGCSRPELAAMSLEYVSEPTVEEKIREFASWIQSGVQTPEPRTLRNLLVRAMATIFLAWRNSGCEVVPGSISPANVVVPEQDFHEGSLVLSLHGWQRFQHTFDLFKPLYTMFFRRTRAHYPAVADYLRDEWMLDAAIEGLDKEAGAELLLRFQRDVEAADGHPFDPAFRGRLDRYLAESARCYRPPLPLLHAIDRFEAWERVNPQVTPEARADQVEGLINLYRLDRFGEAARYHLYRQTYFAALGDEVREAFDRLLDALQSEPGAPATQRIELSDLQATLTSAEDLDVFSRLVFPQAHKPQRLEVLAFGDSERKQVTVRTRITDSRGEGYDVREPVHPEEVGQLYRLFFEEHFPKVIGEGDHYLITTDAADRVIGAICYQLQDANVVHMEGVVVNASYTGRGIATALLEDFVTRMASRGARVVKTGFIMRDFCEKRGFRLDRRWGGLVRILGENEDEEDGDEQQL
jgi:long-subunit acyl-CoA synthetase (AMP-forming)/GNAT superfamily N-acetyltransferase